MGRGLFATPRHSARAMLWPDAPDPPHALPPRPVAAARWSATTVVGGYGPLVHSPGRGEHPRLLPGVGADCPDRRAVAGLDRHLRGPWHRPTARWSRHPGADPTTLPAWRTWPQGTADAPTAPCSTRPTHAGATGVTAQGAAAHPRGVCHPCPDAGTRHVAW